MKRCPTCRRNYYDETLLYCLDDGSTLLEGPASVDEPVTEILHASPSEAATRAQLHITKEQPLTRAKRIVSKPVLIGAVVAVAALGSLFAYRYFDTDRDRIDSIAVLPFQNASAGGDTEYLSDGIAESLIYSLNDLPQLRVIARGTAFRFKGKDADPRDVGRELNVRAVLMGMVRQTGDNLNIQVELVDTATGTQIWGEEYERQVSDLLSIKQAITGMVAEKLRLKLSNEEKQHLADRDTVNAEAYRLYLRGRFFWNKRNADGINQAIQEFQSAINRDPSYALGYAGLADCYLLLEEYAGVPAAEAIPKAKAAAERALQLDATLGEAYASLGYAHIQMWQWAEAEEKLKRAIALNPNYATAHQWYANYFRIMRRFDDALKEVQRAQQLDPLSPILGTNVAFILTLQNKTDAAIEECRRVIQLDPKFPLAYANLGRAYLKMRRYEDAVREFSKAVELSERGSLNLAHLGHTYALMGNREEALAILRELEERQGRGKASGIHLASVHTGLRNKDEAFAWLEKDFQQRSGSELPNITYRLDFDGLRDDPRYADLVRRMGLEL